MACEAICLKPKKSEDATIFDVIFGHPLLPNTNKEMSKQVLWNLMNEFMNKNFVNTWVIPNKNKPISCFFE